MASKESYAIRAVPREEIRELLTELDFRINRTASSKQALIDGAEKEPANPRRNEVLGAEALESDDKMEARERWIKAIDSGSTNAAVFHSLSMLENERWFTDIDLIYFRLPVETGVYLRKLLRSSIQSAPEQTEAYEMLAWIEATSDQPNIDNVNLVQRHYGSLVKKARTALALALVRVRVHDEAGAREILDGMERAQPDEDCVRSIGIIRNYLDAQHVANP